jgi:hypothetical protein
LTESYSHDSEQISHETQNVEQQEYNKKYFLFLWILSEAHENKISDIVPWFHVFFTGADFSSLPTKQ